MIKRNKSLISFIDKTETDANKSVDGILRKYEKYQVNKLWEREREGKCFKIKINIQFFFSLKELLKTITKKHEEEVENERKVINELKKTYEIELPSKYYFKLMMINFAI